MSDNRVEKIRSETSRIRNMSSTNTFPAKYELEGVIETGENCIVSKCLCRETKEERAAKCIDMVTSGRCLGHLNYVYYGEAKICSDLKHANIVRFYESFAEVERYILVFEYVKGGRILEYVGFGSRRCIEDVPYFFKQIIAAVQYFHRQYVVHRDLTPANILITSTSSDATVKVIDFGLAIKAPGRKFYGCVGTPSYRSPEVIKREIYGKPVDIWACGVILYEMLSGEKPFSADSDLELFRRISAAPITFESPNWDHVPEDARNLVREMLCRNQRERITADQAMVHPYLNAVPKAVPKLKSSFCGLV